MFHDALVLFAERRIIKMKKQIINRLLILGICTVCFSINVVKTDVVFAKYCVSMNADRKQKTEWKYKIINGKMYKRLYNCTTKQWIGDWVLV